MADPKKLATSFVTSTAAPISFMGRHSHALCGKQLMLKTREEFEKWLLDIDDKLESLFDSIKINIKLDYSEDSLIDIEKWTIDHYNSIEDLENDFEIYELLAIYVGEVFRINLRIPWDIKLDDPKYAYYQVPEISLPTPVCPFFLLTASIDRQKGNLIKTVYANMKKRYA